MKTKLHLFIMIAFLFSSSYPLQAQFIGCGNYHSLNVCADGSVRSCGDNTFSQLGDSTSMNRYIPVQVHFPSGTVINAVSGGVWFSLFLENNGTAWACGNNSFAP